MESVSLEMNPLIDPEPYLIANGRPSGVYVDERADEYLRAHPWRSVWSVLKTPIPTPAPACRVPALLSDLLCPELAQAGPTQGTAIL